MSAVILHGLAWGLGLAAGLTVTFVGLLAFDAEMWLDDYPHDVRRAFGPMSERAERRKRRWGAIVLAGIVLVLVAATIDLLRAAAVDPTFTTMALHTFSVLMPFNVIDLVIIDWLVFVRVRPDFVVLPGTEGAEGYDDHAYHVRAFAKGTAGITAVSVVAGALAALL